MVRRRDRDLRVLLLTAVVAACGGGAPSPSTTPTATSSLAAVASSFDEYAVGFCSAFQAMFRAVGNPDTGEGSTLSKALDEAVAAGDVVSADRLAPEITSELESGRRHVASARGWVPAAPMMAHLDRVFVAFEAMIAAKQAAASHAPGSVDPQVAFEQAGGLDAWRAMFEVWPTLDAERPDGVQPCADVPILP